MTRGWCGRRINLHLSIDIFLKDFLIIIVFFRRVMIKRAQGRKRFGRKNFKQRYFRLTTQDLTYSKTKGKYIITI